MKMEVKFASTIYVQIEYWAPLGWEFVFGEVFGGFGNMSKFACFLKWQRIQKNLPMERPGAENDDPPPTIYPGSPPGKRSAACGAAPS